jgi:hypothetical protein
MKMQMIRKFAARAGVVALCSAALYTVPMMAQGGGGMMRMTSDQRVAAVDKAVTLTDDQKTKIKAIYDADMKKMQDLREAHAHEDDGDARRGEHENQGAADRRSEAEVRRLSGLDATPREWWRRSGSGDSACWSSAIVRQKRPGRILSPAFLRGWTPKGCRLRLQ